MSHFFFCFRSGLYLGSNTGSVFPIIWHVKASPFFVLIITLGGTDFPLNLIISGFYFFGWGNDLLSSARFCTK